MNLYKSEFQIVDFEESTGLLKETFTSATMNYKEESFKEDFNGVTKAVLKLKGKKLKAMLTDMRDFRYSLVPSLQEWHKDEIYPKMLEVGILKVAIVSGADVFAHVSTQQTYEEYRNGIIETEYFKEIQEAKDWLLQ